MLDVYRRPDDPAYPPVCLDEGCTQLLSEVRAPLPMTPGQPVREDSEYSREGVCSLLFAPLTGWRPVAVTGQRGAVDFAQGVKDLLDHRYPEAQKIVRVRDNLNTHTAASLYQAFPPEEAKRLANRLEIHYTPKQGSGLNRAEIELSVLARQCLNRRLPDRDTLTREVAAWEVARNAAGSTVNWRFPPTDARIKLKKLYPTILS